MDTSRIYLALHGDLDLDDLTVTERLALAHEILRVEVVLPLRNSALRFVVPPEIERFFRGTSS